MVSFGYRYGSHDDARADISLWEKMGRIIYILFLNSDNLKNAVTIYKNIRNIL